MNQGADISLGYVGTIRSSGMMKLGIGIMHHWTSMNESIKVILGAKCYTFSEKIKFALGSGFTLKKLWNAVASISLFERAPELPVPVYVFHGLYDYQVSYQVAREYVQMLKVPVKGFYTFENSAHSPCFEEPDKMIQIIKTDVLHSKTTLADQLSIL